MQAMSLAAPGGIDQLALVDVEPRAPSSHEIQVAIKATSLNFHDYAVVVGLIPAADGRIPDVRWCGRCDCGGRCRQRLFCWR
jgi:NADPH:quinone reductase-like Zn-dependent oxidoreductase